MAYYPTSFAAHAKQRIAPDLLLPLAADKEIATAVNDNGKLSFVRLVDDYEHRHILLSPVPPYFFLMCFEKIQIRTAATFVEDNDSGAMFQGNRRIFRFDAQHPQHETHVIAERTELHLPQAISNFPEAPDESADGMSKDMYAVQMLSMFMSDRLMHHLCAVGCSLWDIWQAWLDKDVVFDVLYQSGFSVDLTSAAWIEVHPSQPATSEGSDSGTMSVAHEFPCGNSDLVVPPVSDANSISVACAAVGNSEFPHGNSTPSGSSDTPLGTVLLNGSGLDILRALQRPFDLLTVLRLLMRLQPVANAALTRWHCVGHHVVRNIQSLVAAQMEDRRIAPLVHRSHMRRAQRMNVGVGEHDSDLDIIDSDDELELHGDDWMVTADHDAPVDHNELLSALLDVTSDATVSAAATYYATAVGGLPDLQLDGAQHQLCIPVAFSHRGYLSADEHKNLMCSADIEQHASQAATVFVADKGSTIFHVTGLGHGMVHAMHLQDASTIHVCARIEFVTLDDVRHEVVLLPKEHGPPPDHKLSTVPSIVDTIKLFTLSAEQAFAFVLLADALLLEKEGVRASQPLRMVLTGEPGTGKSQVLKAFQWFALQYDASSMILVASYTWRAALMVATAKHPALSTCHAFDINPVRHTIGDCSAKLVGVRFVFLDEYSFIDSWHMYDISEAIRKARGGGTDNMCFADMHMVLCGDLCQHQPPGGVPLFVNEVARLEHNACLRAQGAKEGYLRKTVLRSEHECGLNAYRSFETVVFLQQQQRLTSTEDKLYKYSRLFIRGDRPGRDEVAEFCDDLNSRVASPAQWQGWHASQEVPRVVCLRNELRKQLNWSLALLHAQCLGVRPIVWFSQDTLAQGRGKKLPTSPNETTPKVPPIVRSALAFMKQEDTKDVGSMHVFFPGCLYTFTQNIAPQLGIVNNGECAGVDLLLSSGETDDGQHNCWFLRKPPVAIFVKPLDTKVCATAWHHMQLTFPTLPAGCVPITPQWTDKFEVKVFAPDVSPSLGRRKANERAVTYKVRRFGYNVSHAHSVTDYYCQGVSFKMAPWMAHLNLPPTGNLQRAALFVVLTRWGSWEQVCLLSSLWPPGDAAARDRVIDKFHALACLEPELRCELLRLRHAHAQTKQVLGGQWARALAATT